LRNRNSSATIAPDGYVIPSLDQYGRRFRYTQPFGGVTISERRIERRGQRGKIGRGGRRFTFTLQDRHSLGTLYR
jgi:hypothetical protein